MEVTTKVLVGSVRSLEQTYLMTLPTTMITTTTTMITLTTTATTTATTTKRKLSLGHRPYHHQAREDQTLPSCLPLLHHLQWDPVMDTVVVRMEHQRKVGHLLLLLLKKESQKQTPTNEIRRMI